MKKIKLEDLRRVVRQIIQPLARGKIDSTKGLLGKLFELIPNHSRSPEDNAADNFQTASPFGFISKPTKGVLAYFLNFLGDVQVPVIINHIHIARPEPSAPGESITYSTNTAGNTVVCKITHFNDGRIKIEADAKIELIAPTVEIIASVKAKITAPDIEAIATTKIKVTAPVIEADASTSAKITTPLLTLEGSDLVTIKSAVKVVLDAPSVDLGVAAAEGLIKGGAFKAFFDLHTHGVVPGPVPTVLLPAAVVSTASKTL